jgi:hypothetical protein
MTTMDVAPPTTATHLLKLITGRWISKAISVSADLAIADLLLDGPQDLGRLAEKTGTHPPSLYRLLRALTVPGVFAELPGKRFELTPLGRHLCTDNPDSLRNIARLFGSHWHSRSWEELRHSVTTGGTGLQLAMDAGGFDYLAQNPDDSAVFDGAMTDYSRILAPAIVDAYDFGRFRQIVDVAGGHGYLLAAILRAYAGPYGLVYELPHVIEGTRRWLKRSGLNGRCDAVAGDFFQFLPAGADAYLLKSIIHDWNDERAVAILSNCRRAISPRGRLLLCECLVSAPGQPSFAKLLDLEMMVIPGGKERTAEEYRGLLAAAGFRLIGIHPTASPMSILEGVPVIS